MPATEDIRDVFSFLHDGTISAWMGDKNMLTLIVDCEYLAARIDKSFEKFYVELFEIDKIKFEPWVNPTDLPATVKTDFADIFKTELEILSADLKEVSVVVACNQHDADFGYCGGNLTISCQAIKVFDQNKNRLTIGQLSLLCKSYWDEWSKK